MGIGIKGLLDEDNYTPPFNLQNYYEWQMKLFNTKKQTYDKTMRNCARAKYGRH